MSNDQPSNPETPNLEPPKVKKPRGFAAMTPEERSRISSLGGKEAHKRGVAHRWTSDEAAIAGRIGGEATHKKKAARE